MMYDLSDMLFNSAQKQIWRPVEQNKGPRYESMQLYPTNFWQRCQCQIHIVEKRQPFNKCCWENWIFACRKRKLDWCFSPCININSKWIKDLYVRPETLKLLQERAGNRHRQGLPQQNSSGSATKREGWQIGLNEIKKLLHKKGNGL
jgi:hypothetical protein